MASEQGHGDTAAFLLCSLWDPSLLREPGRRAERTSVSPRRAHTEGHQQPVSALCPG